VNGLAVRTQHLALTAERATVDRQHVGLSSGGQAAVVGALQLATADLWAATRALGLPPVLHRRTVIWACVTSALTIVLITAALLLVPDPGRPWVLALVVSSSLGSQLVWRAAQVIRDHRNPPAPARPLEEVLSELRAGLASVGAALDPADGNAGRHLELAGIWLDDAEAEAGGAP
jgi:hypothetical protein